MFKKLMFTGVLLISISALKAKSIRPVVNIATKTIFLNVEEDLINKLASDNDFINYYISNVKFANKIIERKAGSIFQKYIQNTISADEQADLFAKMNVNNKKEFDAIAVNSRNQAIFFFNKFPKLKLMPEKDQKELLINAFKKLSNDNYVTTKLVKAKNVTVDQCFWIWMACNSLCAMGCTYDPNWSNCMWQCTAACAASYGVCWLIAD
jgi:hypothetical protein